MASTYLQGGDLAAYGVPSAAASDIVAASLLIDAYLRRPEGLVWSPDGAGQPCYMAGLTPSLSFTAGGAIAPGANVVVPVTGGFVHPDLVGEVLVLDRSQAGVTEACVVTAVGTTSVTLAGVAFAHASGAVLEAGLVILEERALPANRSVTRIARTPMARMVAVQGRYAYGRRSQQQAGVFAQPSILSSVQVFGGPPAWYPVDVAHVSTSPSSGEVWIPAGALVANFSDVRMRYVAGWAQAALPAAIKQAVAAVVQQTDNFPELRGNMKSLQAGGTKLERFSDSLLDAETKARLDPFEMKLFV